LLIRLTVLVAYYQKLSIERIAGCLNISVKSIRRWIKRYKSKGIDFVRDEDRSGRPSGLNIEQQEHLKTKYNNRISAYGFARHVAVLIQTLFGVLYSVGYLPQLLNKLGLSFHKAETTLIKRDSEKRRVWIQETLPEIYWKKIEAGWRIFYQDEVGFQTKGTLAYTWGVRGQSTTIANYGRHGRINLIGAFELDRACFTCTNDFQNKRDALPSIYLPPQTTDAY